MLSFIGIESIQSQTFSAEEIGIITDKHDSEIYPSWFLIPVSGLPKSTDSSYGLEKVCFHIKHKRPTDLKIELLSPSGTSVWLSNRNGSDNNYGYLNTCVVQEGFHGPIYRPNLYFEGEYSAEGRLDFFNDGEDPNGNWILIITDLKEGILGKLEDVNISFSDNPATFKKSSCTIPNPVSCKVSDSQKRLLPNLIVSEKLTRENIVYYGPNHPERQNQLRFAAAMANIGEGPLHIITTNNWYCGEKKVDENSVCSDGNSPTNNVLQIVYRLDEDKKMIFDTLKSGIMYFDDSPGHNHYHVKNWASFKVLKKRWWTNNPNCWKEVAQSNKVSYCLFDNKICTAENSYCGSEDEFYSSKNLPNYGLGRFSSCDSKIQGISVGGIDYYGMFYEGQHIDLPENIAKGKYYLYIEVDPNNEYFENNEEDNYILIPFEI